MRVNTLKPINEPVWRGNLGEIEVVYNSQTGTTMVYPNIPSNPYYWQAPAPHPYFSPNIPNVFFPLLRLYW